MDADKESSAVPIDYPGRPMVAIWPALALAALCFNVFYLRRKHPGIISGKLSDVAINFLLPIFLVAAAEWSLALMRLLGARIEARVGLRGIVLACLSSATYFTLLKVVPAFTEVHRGLLSMLDAPFGGSRAFRNIADPTDLVALVCNPLAAIYLVKSLRRRIDPHG